jgi:hypothetical protein
MYCENEVFMAVKICTVVFWIMMCNLVGTY